MKYITRQDKGFRQYLNGLCDIMPGLRLIAKDVDKIEVHDKGLLFLSLQGEKLSSISQATIQKEQQEYKTIWNPESHQLF